MSASTPREDEECALRRRILKENVPWDAEGLESGKHFSLFRENKTVFRGLDKVWRKTGGKYDMFVLWRDIEFLRKETGGSTSTDTERH